MNRDCYGTFVQVETKVHINSQLYYRCLRDGIFTKVPNNQIKDCPHCGYPISGDDRILLRTAYTKPGLYVKLPSLGEVLFTELGQT